MLRALLPQGRVEVPGDDHRLLFRVLLDGADHVLGPPVPHLLVANAAPLAVHAPVRVEVPEGLARADVGQLHPGHIPRAPLAGGVEVSAPFVARGEETRLHHHALRAFEGRSRLQSPRAALNGARGVTLLQPGAVWLQRVPKIVDDAVALPGVLIEGVPPVQVVGDDHRFQVPFPHGEGGGGGGEAAVDAEVGFAAALDGAGL
mmetsp:Transcript_67202/g.160254  ORF Transcript_67202/g.160254 Transcript_67202/m.160254 type:complete len:203 (-) Transcript_67202:930-1538(-)